MKLNKIALLVFSAFTLSGCSSIESLSNGSSASTKSADTSQPSTPIPSSSKHEHTFAEGWTYDETSHWHAATCEHTDEVSKLGDHDYDEVETPATFEEAGKIVYTCKVCGYSYEEPLEQLEHNYSAKWSSDETKHWHACTDKGYEELSEDEAEHEFELKEEVEADYEHGGYDLYECTVCKYQEKRNETEVLVNETVQYMKFTLNDNEDGYVLTGYEGEPTELKIPAKYNDLPVVGIGEEALKDCATLTKVEFLSEDNIKYVGKGAFEGCGELTNCELPESVTVIPARLFLNCKKLSASAIPDKCTYIGYQAYKNCAAIPSAGIPKTVTDIHSEAFRNCTNLTSVFFTGLSGAGNSLQWLGDSVFDGCSKLYKSKSEKLDYILNYTICMGINEDTTTTVVGFTISDGCKFIIDYAFRNESHVQSLRLPSTLLGIGKYAFSGCSKLANVTIPSSVKKIGSGALPSSMISAITGNPVKYMGSVAVGCTNKTTVTSVTLASGTKALYQNALSSAGLMTNISLNNGLLYIGSSALAYDVSLTTITIPSSIIEIADFALSGCTSLETISYNGTVSQWKDVILGSSWANKVAATYVTCSDGNVDIA